ncbi:Taurine catabolism dioxygenase TauD, TfdA family [Beggiatoa alba B18LD]|uniref:Taurine catabolism dioxygenase TauD, TfdA family n=1 Tax=Beggiatoa alba B18LD TaxID=395493 RepID=I3CIW9_9GAMM|nr:TauD/TfdA family dioxygenase [Beggiatoa alba]EIJ43562.1 Taurine catabolism dioxygenase TauD, TfdA family [Beggiatoa alba B18LD]
MAILSISTPLRAHISSIAHHINVFVQSDIDSFIQQNKYFLLIYQSVEKILDKNCFVVIKNIGFNRNRAIFESFIKLFGRFYGVVEYTGIKVDCAYTGCSYNALTLHNDDAVDLNNPKYTFIQVLSEDPNGTNFGWNGVVRIDDVFEYLTLHDKALLDKLFNYHFPMLSYGVSAYSESREEIILREPIFTYHRGYLKVRFDLSRIKHFYFKKEIAMPDEEKLILDKFLSVCQQFRKRYYLSCGDILIVDNHRTLHDREETTLELDEDGRFISREILVSFAYEKN